MTTEEQVKENLKRIQEKAGEIESIMAKVKMLESEIATLERQNRMLEGDGIYSCLKPYGND